MEEVQHLDMLCRLVTSGMTVTLLVVDGGVLV